MIIFPHAKINIGLSITAKRADGYHNIESIFYPIPLYDVLEIVKSKKFSFEHSGLHIEGEDENNLVIKAYNLLRRDYNLGPVAIHLHKVIPMGAGLGGGSSNGTFALRLLNDLFELGLSYSSLQDYANKLGSDCPFFLKDRAKWVCGRGEILTESKLNLEGYYLKLVNPKIHINTELAFKGIIPKKSDGDLSIVSTNNFESKLNILKNDFEPNIFRSYPEIKKIKTKLISEGAIFSSMSGTGSTVYGIYKSKPEMSFNNYSEWVFQLK